MDRKLMLDGNGKFSKEYYSGNFKQIIIYTSDNQKKGIDEFFESIGFYGYTIITNLESSWSRRLKHRNSNAWPGTDCMFMITMREESVDEFLKKIKEYRMTLVENILFAVAITPVERIIPDLYNFDI
ncbi:MAG: PG0541 family transporter-associated protein [Fusobacteriaceae bacterium]